MNSSTPYARVVLAPIAKRLHSYIQDDLGIAVKSAQDVPKPTAITLKSFTVNIGLGGSVSMLFVLSYDMPLIEALTRAFAMDDVPPEELDEIQESVASEVGNIVLGNSICEFPEGGKGVTMTPPLVIQQAKSISAGKDAHIATTVIATEYGDLAASIVWPYKI